MSFETTALLLTWAAIVLLSLVVAGLIRHVHALGLGGRDPAPSVIRLPVGAHAPGFDRLAPVPTAPVLLLFLSTECPSCAAVLAEVRQLAGHAPVAIRALFAGPPMVGAETSGIPVYAGEADLFTAYGVPATPFGVLVDPTGRIRRAVPVGSPQAVRDLVSIQPGPVRGAGDRPAALTPAVSTAGSHSGPAAVPTAAGPTAAGPMTPPRPAGMMSKEPPAPHEAPAHEGTPTAGGQW